MKSLDVILDERQELSLQLSSNKITITEYRERVSVLDDLITEMYNRHNNKDAK